MSKIITIKEANISTLSVELKAIHINSKQMTLSVFRQIQEEDIWTEDFKLHGIPWGTVNYFWDKAPQFNGGVIHVVWQKNNELRRFRATNIVNGNSYSAPKHSIEYIHNQYLGNLEYRLSVINNFLSGKDTYTVKEENKYKQINNIQIHHPSHYEKDGVFECHYTEDQLKEKWYLEQWEERKKKYEQGKFLANRDLLEKPKLERLIAQKKSEASAFIENWRSAYNQLSALPQLYIAA